ncbi:MAG: hypothetical protein GX107_07690 [Clostridiales bacterium]|jgi:Kef-type K+ transport system membrane component KefB|nr:hypothetical protein [Clostridiales bacterium]
MDYFRTTWFIMALLIVVAPVGIIAMWLFKIDWDREAKVALSAIFGMLFVFLCVASASRTKLDTEINAQQTVVVTESTTKIRVYRDYFKPLLTETDEATMS